MESWKLISMTFPQPSFETVPKYKSQQSRRNMKQGCSDPWPSRQQDPCRLVIPYGIFLRPVSHTLYSPHSGSIGTWTLGSSEWNSFFLNGARITRWLKIDFGVRLLGSGSQPDHLPAMRPWASNFVPPCLSFPLWKLEMLIKPISKIFCKDD